MKSHGSRPMISAGRWPKRKPKAAFVSTIFLPSWIAIPSRVAEPVIKQLIEHGEVRRGWLGVHIQTVTEETIARAIGFIAREERLVIEGSAAVGVAALLERVPLPGGGPVCVVLTGRNIDHQRLRSILRPPVG